jgi:hypothetical protein
LNSNSLSLFHLLEEREEKVLEDKRVSLEGLPFSKGGFFQRGE